MSFFCRTTRSRCLGLTTAKCGDTQLRVLILGMSLLGLANDSFQHRRKVKNGKNSSRMGRRVCRRPCDALFLQFRYRQVGAGQDYLPNTKHYLACSTNSSSFPSSFRLSREVHGYHWHTVAENEPDMINVGTRAA